MSDIDKVLAQLDGQREAALQRLFSFIRIESISNDPAYKEACLKAAEMARGFLDEIGFEAEVALTSGHPMVLGHYRSQQLAKSGASKPHLLFYGHYDVQPVDPLGDWHRPPFDPCLVETGENGTVIHGRGSSDDKGQLMTFLEAARAWREVTGDLPIDVTVLLEGEEECGSPSLDEFLKQRSGALKADFALVCDTLQWDKDTPGITTMLRGLASLEVRVTGPNRDLHSGMYGGPALNPLKALARAIASLHDEKGRVLVPGFYEGVREPEKAVSEQWRSSGFEEADFLEDIGLTQTHGEKGYSLLEQLWCRPTIEVNGLWGGYTGPGHKTVIPSKATAKLSFRLVAGQNPQNIIGAIKDHLRAALGPDIRAEFDDPQGSAAVDFDLEKPQIKIAEEVLEAEFKRKPVRLGCGGSIPIVEVFERELGLDCLLIGFALNDDCIHAPDEKYNLKSFEKGARAFARFIGRLATD